MLLVVWFGKFHPSSGDIYQAFRQYFIWADFSPVDLARNWAEFLHALLTTAGLGALARHIGSMELTLFEGRSVPSCLSALAAGLGTLGTAVLGAGLLGLLFFPMPLFGSALAAFALWELRRFARGKYLPDTAGWFSMISLPGRLFILGSLLIVCAGIFNLEMSWDAMSYHLRLPSFFLYHHKIYSVWHHYCSPFPSLIEMLYLLGLAIQGDQAVRLLNAFLGISLLIATRALAHAVGAKGHVASLLILGSPLFLMLVTRAYIDLGFALFFTLSLLHILHWRNGRGLSHVAVSALLAGFGMSCKYIGVLFIPAFFAAAAPGLVRSRRTADGLRAAFIWASLALLPLAAWLLKNWFFTANPVSPMLSSVFGTDDERPAFLMVNFPPMGTIAEAAFSFGNRILAFFFDNGRVDGPLSAAVGSALPLLFLRLPSPDLRLLRRALLAYTAGWLLLCPDIRFLLPALPALCVLLEFKLVPFLSAKRHLFPQLFKILFELGIIAGALFAASLQWTFFAPFSLPLGLETRQSRLALGLPPAPFHFYAREFINSSVPEGSRIMQVSNFSSYFIERECISDFHFGRAHISRIIRDAGSPAEIARRFRRRGVGWLLHSRAGTRQYLDIPGFFGATVAEWGEFKEFLSTRTEIAWQTDGYTLFRIVGRGQAHPCPSLPAYETIAFRLADEALGRGEAAAALSAYLRPPDLLSDVGSTALRQAEGFMLLERPKEARDAFLRALELGAEVPRAHIGLAQIYLTSGNLPQALRHALVARRTNPLSGYAAASLAIIYGRMGKLDMALENIRIARRLAPYQEEYKRIESRLAGKVSP